MTPSRTTLSLAAAAFGAALAFSGPAAFAQAGPNSGVPPASSAPASSGMPSAASGSTATAPKNAQIDARINRLHSQLKITSAQQSQWDQVAQIMRQNAEQMSALIRQRDEAAAHPQSMNAVQNLQNYQQIADAHAAGIDHLVPAFQALYNEMSPSQKKTADTLFNQRLAQRVHASASRSTTSHSSATNHS